MSSVVTGVVLSRLRRRAGDVLATISLAPRGEYRPPKLTTVVRNHLVRMLVGPACRLDLPLAETPSGRDPPSAVWLLQPRVWRYL